MPATIDDLHEELQELDSKMTDILETAKEKSGGQLSEEQREKFDELDAKYDTKQKALDEWLKDLDRQEKLTKRQAKLAKSVPPRVTQPDPITPSQQEEPEELNFGSFGEQLHAIFEAGNPQLGFRLDDRLASLAPTGSNIGTPSDGGFLVQPTFASEILKKMYDVGQILSRVRRIPVGANSNGLKINAIDESSRATGSRLGGIRVYRKEEGEQGTGSKPKLRQLELVLKKLFGLWYATDELLEDAIAMDMIAREGFAEEFAFTNENEIINGAGGAEMLGILNSPCLVTVAEESGQAANTIVKENIDKMWSRMHSRSMLNGVWLVNQDTFPQLFALSQPVGTGGVPVWLPPGGISGTPYSTIYGRPVIPVEYCSTLGTVGDIIFADFTQYLTIEKGGLRGDSSMHLRFDYGETAFRWVMRNDGRPSWDSALTPFKGASNTVSPFVALATRS